MSEPGKKPFGFEVLQRFLRLVVRLLTRADVRGLENLPTHGPTILASNHVAWFDVVLVLAFTRTSVVTFAAEKWEVSKSVGPLMRHIGRAIFVQRGEVDRAALGQALDALRRGEVLAVAPEGTRSYTGVLAKAHDGAAWMASRTDAEIVPIAMWGHEDVLGDWKRLHRPRVALHVGPAFKLPPEAAKARSRDLPQYTDMIMRKIAAMLPPERRGDYA